MIKLKGCHLTGNNLDELDKFAREIGLSRCWYVPGPSPYYELICPHLMEIAETKLKRKYR